LAEAAQLLWLRERRAYGKGGKTHRHQPMFHHRILLKTIVHLPIRFG
jgi:hypothetical protein